MHVQLTVLLCELLGLFVRDVPLRLQVGFVPNEDDHLQGVQSRLEVRRQSHAAGLNEQEVRLSVLLSNSVDGDRERETEAAASSSSYNVMRPVVWWLTESSVVRGSRKQARQPQQLLQSKLLSTLV